MTQETHSNVFAPTGRTGGTTPTSSPHFPLKSNISNFNEFFEEFIKAKGHLGTNSWSKNMSNFLLGSRNGISIIDLEYTLTSLRRVLKFLSNMISYRLDNFPKHEKLSRGGQGRLHPALPITFRETLLLPNQPKFIEEPLGLSSGGGLTLPCSHTSSTKSFPHILFVNTCSKYSELVKQTALKSNQSYINERWIGGTLTNWKQISESILLYNKFHIQFDKFLKNFDFHTRLH